jgi:hypothetical protein
MLEKREAFLKEKLCLEKRKTKVINCSWLVQLSTICCRIHYGSRMYTTHFSAPKDQNMFSLATHNVVSFWLICRQHSYGSVVRCGTIPLRCLFLCK